MFCKFLSNIIMQHGVTMELQKSTDNDMVWRFSETLAFTEGSCCVTHIITVEL